MRDQEAPRIDWTVALRHFQEVAGPLRWIMREWFVRRRPVAQRNRLASHGEGVNPTAPEGLEAVRLLGLTPAAFVAMPDDGEGLGYHVLFAWLMGVGTLAPLDALAGPEASALPDPATN